MTGTVSGSPPDAAADDRGDDDREADDREADRSARRRRARSLVEWMVVLTGAVVLAVAARGYVIESFWIPTGSMEPTLAVGDRVMVNKMDDSLGDIDRGDIVVFERPPASVSNDGVDDLIKRAIAFPGETVEGHDGQVWIDGEPLDEPWLADDVATGDFPPTTLGDGEFWAMGDNRGNSSDSRVFGPVDGDLLVGQAVIRVWPLDRAGGL